jgi:dTDP-4-amino-4,6-dideoxygalactose transaminase
MGFNFKFTDILASVGLAQLTRVPERVAHLKTIYELYKDAIRGLSYLKLIPVNIDNGEIPLYIEVLCEERDDLAKYFQQRNIQVRLFNPSIERSPRISSNGSFPNSKIFEEKGMFLPCGPAQPLENVKEVIGLLREYKTQRCVV